MEHNAFVRRSKSQQKYVVYCAACGYSYKTTVKKQALRNCENHNANVKRGARVNVAAMPEFNTKAYWMRYAVDNALKELGQGASRTVYALDDSRVLKIEHALFHGRSQCENEARAWRNADENTRTFLAEVIESGAGWSIMSRGKMTIYDMFGGRHGDVGAMQTLCVTISAETNINDLHAKNIAYFGRGQFKIIDYGL